MGRFTMDDAEHYGGQGGAGYFRLANDGDVARVRFLYTSIQDVEGCAVHQVKINDKYKYVNCLRSYNEPKDNCPFCREGMAQMAKVFIPLYDITEDKVKIWDRGKTFFSKLSSLCSRYPNLVSHVFEIERHGKAHDTGTTYDIFPMDVDEPASIDDFELPEIISPNGTVMDKSAEDMEYFLTEREFPPTDDDEPMPRPRRGTSQDQEDPPARRGSTGRRTPAARSGNSF